MAVYFYLQHERSLENPDLNPSKVEPTRKRISKAFLALMYCLDELGLWLAWKVGVSIILVCYLAFLALPDMHF